VLETPLVPAVPTVDVVSGLVRSALIEAIAQILVLTFRHQIGPKDDESHPKVVTHSLCPENIHSSWYSFLIVLM